MRRDQRPSESDNGVSKRRRGTALAATLLIGIFSWPAAAFAEEPVALTSDQQARLKSVQTLDWSQAPTVRAHVGSGPPSQTGPMAARRLATPRTGYAGGGVKVLSQPPYGNSLYYSPIYAQNRGGGIVACQLEIFTDTPQPTLGIRYGNTVQCEDPTISGVASTALADIRPTGPSGLPGPYAVQADQGGHSFTGDGQAHYEDELYQRISESQTEIVYAYFIADIAGGKWLTQPSGNASSIRCTPTGTSKMTCEIISNHFAFIPDANLVQNCLGSGTGECAQARISQAQAQQIVNGAPATAAAALASAQAAADDDTLTDAQIDALTAEGAQIAATSDALVASPASQQLSMASERLFGLPSPSQVYMYAKCGAAVVTFVGSNLFLLGKVRKAGGFAKLAVRLVKARRASDVLTATLGAAADFTGATEVIDACT